MKKFRDEIADICHEIVEDGYRADKITDTEMKEFESDCFVNDDKASYVAENSLKTEYITA